MTKQEILSIVNELPDDKDISLLVYDGQDNWDASSLFVDNFDGYDTADLVFELDKAYMVTSYVDTDADDLSDAVEELVEAQDYNEAALMVVSNLVGPDQASEVGTFIGACKKEAKAFVKANIFSVINGHYPYMDGVNIVGLYLNVIEMEVKHRYKTWEMKEEIIKDCKFYPMTQQEAFIKYFRDYDTRLKFCNDDKHSIIDDDLREQYRAWLTKGNYAKYGGDMH